MIVLIAVWGRRALENLTHQLRSAVTQLPISKTKRSRPICNPVDCSNSAYRQRNSKSVATFCLSLSLLMALFLFAIGGGYAASHETYTKKCHALRCWISPRLRGRGVRRTEKTEPLSLLLLYKIVSPHPSYIVYIMFFSSAEASPL
jgi:hypothetical protein